MTLILKVGFLLFVLNLSSCSNMPLKKMKQDRAQKIEILLIGGNLNVDKYKTISRIKVYAVDDKTKKRKLTEKKLELSNFSLNRQTVSVSGGGEAHLKYWVTDLKGDVDLTNMGLPLQGKTLMETVNKYAQVLAVKGFPEETIFYLPKIALPKKDVKPGDTWPFKGKWRSLKTGWPFKVSLDLRLASWVSCGGLQCAHIKYTGNISLPEDNPLKEARLNSKIVGEFVYAPVGHQFIWSYAKSVETFISPKKKVDVHSCTASYQISPDKEAKVFSKKFRRFCN